MSDRCKYCVCYFLYWLFLFLFLKPIFLLFHWGDSSSFSLGDWLGVVYHGLPMDLSTAGYFSALVVLALSVSAFFDENRWLDRFIKGYTYVALSLAVLVVVADLVLYSYWGFRIDSTPLFYLKTPKNAMASATAGQLAGSILLLLVMFVAALLIFRFMHKRLFKIRGRNVFYLLPSLLFAFLIVFFIRGGLGVSTMNAGRVYFSNSVFLNHAAINPVWNFIYSLSRNDTFEGRYVYYSEDRTAAYFSEMVEPAADSTTLSLLKTPRPNIVMVILESFGSTSCEALGGKKGVMSNLSSLASEGVLFTRFYANSFRTDRGLVALLSGYPAQPTTSLMKYPNKSQNVAKFPLSLKKAGYDLSFYYGGDDNFTNMRSYLVMSGFEKIVNEDDFSSEEMSEKWGAYDHALFQRVMADLRQPQGNAPFFKLLLTLNSHEPFDVPMHRFDNEYLNAVAYTDSCLGAFVSNLKKTPFWDSTLVVLVADHAYRYPDTLSGSDEVRHRIPMLWLGGALRDTLRVDTVASQIDLARTLLSQLDIDASDFKFSKNIFGKDSPKFAFYAFNEGFGMVSDSTVSIYDCGAEKSLLEMDSTLTIKGKAYLQSLFDDLSKR
ncbi:MAG: sulfatase-like hydrolase/transferase [Paludibacteraceae bacterium]|nr:sulfatase-like hydrolase/transferase [Paludibacteraceae bacterium]